MRYFLRPTKLRWSRKENLREGTYRPRAWVYSQTRSTGPERPTPLRLDNEATTLKTATQLARSRSVRIGVVRFEKNLVAILSAKRQLSVAKLSAKRIYSLAKRDFLVANGRMAADFSSPGGKVSVCRASCPISKQGASALPKNVIAPAKRRVECDVCRNTDAKAWCSTCEVFVCEEHVAKHMTSTPKSSKDRGGHLFVMSDSLEMAGAEKGKFKEAVTLCSSHGQPASVLLSEMQCTGVWRLHDCWTTRWSQRDEGCQHCC